MSNFDESLNVFFHFPYKKKKNVNQTWSVYFMSGFSNPGLINSTHNKSKEQQLIIFKSFPILNVTKFTGRHY